MSNSIFSDLTAKIHARVTPSTKATLEKLYKKLNAVDGFPEKFTKRTGRRFSFQAFIDDCVDAQGKILAKKHKKLLEV